MTRSFAAVLLDLDGTLVDSLADLHQAVNHILQCHGRDPLGPDRVRTYIGDGVRVLLARSFLGWEETPIDEGAAGVRDGDREVARQAAIRDLLERAASLTAPTLDEGLLEFREFYGDHLLDHTRCYAGVPETLAALDARGVALGIVSNKPEGSTRKITAGLDLERFFRVIVGGDTVATAKPSPEPLLHALDVMGVRPEETLMVGDSVNDILSGQKAGCKTALAEYGLGDSAVVSMYKPDFRIEAFDELAALIEGP